MRVFRAWVAASQLVLCIAGDCSDSVGSCATKQASLMQFKSLSQKKQSLALDSTVSVSSRLAVFQKFADEMIAKYEQTPEEENAAQQVDQNTLDAVFMVLRYIEGMHSLLTGAHDDDVSEAAEMASIYELCIQEKMNDDIVKDILAAQSADSLAKDAHDKCIEMTASPCNQKCAVNGPCTQYDGYRMSGQGDLPDCVEAAGKEDTAFSDSFIRAAEGSNKLGKMEACLEDTKEWLDPLYDHYKACERVGDDCESNVTACDKLQHTFQQKRCQYAIESELHCSQLTSCFSVKQTGCGETCSKIKIRAAARAADNETGERLICLLQNLFGTPTPDSVSRAEQSPDAPLVNATFGPRPTKEERTAGLEKCKKEEIVVEGWNIPCECPDTPPLNTNGYECPQGGVARPCTATFVSENNWNTVLTGLQYCDDKAARGAGRVVDIGICEGDVCLV